MVLEEVHERGLDGILRKVPAPTYLCEVRGCGRLLKVIREHHQRGFGQVAYTMRCERDHEYFIVQGKVPSKYNRR